jgi:hypothetical protein
MIVMLLWVKNSMGKKEVWDSVFHDAVSSSFVAKGWGQSLCTFLQSRHKHHSSMHNWMFGLPENDECTLHFGVHLSHLSWSRWLQNFPFKLLGIAHAFFPEHVSNHSRGLHCTFSEICEKMMHTHCWIHHKIASGEIHDYKWKDIENQHVHPAGLNFVHWLPWYASTFIYHCITLLPLLYEWQQQSRKLWIKGSTQCFSTTKSKHQISTDTLYGRMVPT